MNISIRDLSFTYPGGVDALHDISLEFRPGECVAVIGRNGSGKTTLAKHLNGLLRPTRGDVLVGDWNTRSHTVAQLARRVGYLFQNPGDQIFKNRVDGEVAFGPRSLGLPAADVTLRVELALAQTGLAEFRAVHPYELLPAQRKWVALASLLAMDPAVLVLDEPTAGQDARGLERLAALLAALTRGGKTVVMIAHDMDFCAETSPRVVVMGQGRVLADGDKHSIFAQIELLAQTFVEPPQITRLGLALALPKPVTTVPEFLDELSGRDAQTKS